MKQNIGWSLLLVCVGIVLANGHAQAHFFDPWMSLDFGLLVDTSKNLDNKIYNIIIIIKATTIII